MVIMRKKLITLGTGGVGKTSLLIRYCRNEFPEIYVPIAFENYVADIEVNGKNIELELWETDNYCCDNYQPPSLVYSRTDIFLVCFSIDCPESLDDVIEKWFPEVQTYRSSYCHNAQIVLVGTKKDRRVNDEAVDEFQVSTSIGFSVAKVIGARRYLECSAKSGEGVTNVFEETGRLLLEMKKKSRICTIF